MEGIMQPEREVAQLSVAVRMSALLLVPSKME
jgi:hypothetical protein